MLPHVEFHMGDIRVMSDKEGKFELAKMVEHNTASNMLTVWSTIKLEKKKIRNMLDASKG